MSKLLSCNRKSVMNCYECKINMDSNLLGAAVVRERLVSDKQKQVESSKNCKNKYKRKWIDHSRVFILQWHVNVMNGSL